MEIVMNPLFGRENIRNELLSVKTLFRFCYFRFLKLRFRFPVGESFSLIFSFVGCHPFTARPRGSRVSCHAVDFEQPRPGSD